MFNVLIVKVRLAHLSFLTVAIFGCDQGVPSPEERDSNSSPEANTTISSSNTQEVLNPELPSLPEKPDVLPPPPVIPPTPEAPTFTPELLAAVKHWKAVPQSVFPLGDISLKKPINFQIKTSSGRLIGNSPKGVGEEVVAIGIRDDQLYVSPSKTSSQRTSIHVDQTDFKTSVAYLFEVRKRQRAAFEAELAQRKKNIATRTGATNSSRKPKPKSHSQVGGRAYSHEPLFEDIPPPMDFGHGKFCVCGDCRRKRKRHSEN